ncbi:hypothetical protein EJ110_NYTH27230 [Nymphaea thermarum]|nr:hypothetical protein EJ110_NYTH27230 [Nymphaea thermarum]
MRACGKESLKHYQHNVIREAFGSPNELNAYVKILNNEADDHVPLSLSMQEKLRRKKLKGASRLFNQNHDGYISAEELRNVMINLGEAATGEEARQMINAADTYEEFAKLMKADYDTPHRKALQLGNSDCSFYVEKNPASLILSRLHCSFSGSDGMLAVYQSRSPNLIGHLSP